MALKGQVQQEHGSITLYQSAKNTILNLLGIDRTFEELMSANDVGRALQLFDDNSKEVEISMSEYNPETHYKVFKRPNKVRTGKDVYESEKLPRAYQKLINEVELFFLLDRPIVFKNDSEGNDIAFEAFLKVLKDTRFDSQIRNIKRLAGALTECAHYWRVYKDFDNSIKTQSIILSADKGYTLRPMFDQYDTLVAFAWEYMIKDGTKAIPMTEIETSEWHYTCTKAKGGWQVEKTPNLTGKINIIYYKQQKAWEGAQRRIERLELIDSKIADVNNYFSAPKLIIHADMLDSLPDSTKVVGETITYEGDLQGLNVENLIRYLEFPTAPELQKQEIDNLIQTINLDTLTPNFDFQSLRGLGDLSGEAIQRAMLLGYLKRNMLLEVYEEMISREVSLILAIMMNRTHVSLRSQLERLDISATFADPFINEDLSNANTIAELYQKGVVSLQTAVEKVGLYNNLDEELNMINNTVQTN